VVDALWAIAPKAINADNILTLTRLSTSSFQGCINSVLRYRFSTAQQSIEIADFGASCQSQNLFLLLLETLHLNESLVASSRSLP
jgi:hypothetical protein